MTLALAAAPLLLALLFAWFVRLERDDQRETVFGVVVGVLLFELLTQASQHQVPNGLFRIPFPVGGGLRPPDVLIPAALAARAAVHPFPTRIQPSSFLWGVFFAWYATAAVMGYLWGNPLEQVLFHARAILYVGGGLALASGIRVRRLTRAHVMTPWAIVLGLVAVSYFVFMLVPVTPLAAAVPGAWIEFGTLGADEAVILPVLGAMILVVEVARARRRASVVLASVVLMVTPLAGTGAAGLLVTGIMVTLATVVALTPTWRRRARVTPTEGLLFAGAVLFVAIPMLAATAEQGTFNPSENVERALFSESQSDTTQYRYELWGQALDTISSDPVFGAGLGVQYEHGQPWPLLPFWTTAHNVFLDVGTRSGLVGLVLFVAALAATAREALLAWRWHPSRRVAAFALACLVGVVGLLANGMVSSALEKFRQAALLGLLFGLIASAARSALEETGVRRRLRRHPVGVAG